MKNDKNIVATKEIVIKGKKVKITICKPMRAKGVSKSYSIRPKSGS